MPPPVRAQKKKKLAGNLRRSQLLTTYGCGSLVDFPRLSGIMAGLESWPVQLLPESAKIRERNLEIMLGKEFFYQVSSPDTDLDKKFTLPALRFPSWYYCPECHRLDHFKKISRSTSSNTSDYNSALICNQCSDSVKQVKLIPSRFIVACLNGHIDDFPYDFWVHRKKGYCGNSQLFLEYKGTTGGLDSIHIRCSTCEESTTMAGCMSKDALRGFACKGLMPWLGFVEKDGRYRFYTDPSGCHASPRVLQRGANNVYYPVNKSALTIPPWSEKLQSIMAQKDSLFTDIFDEEDQNDTIRRLKKQFNKDPELYGGDETGFIAAAFRRYRDVPENVDEKSLRMDEYRAFCGADMDDDQFRTESIEVPEFMRDYISQIKLVKKLREVMVLQGFRRILPHYETDPDERQKLGMSNAEFAPISRTPMNWLPAIELFGEGIFIQLDERAVERWEEENHSRYLSLATRHENSKWIGKGMFDENHPRFILLHTLSHLLIRQLSSQCGYAAASIKEKIYSTYVDEDFRMCGILIYTSATDTDGSLGGLVREGYPDRIKTTFEEMLEESSWCSNDPLCIETTSQGYRGLNYASCHACALLPETCCESMNCLLDRASVVGTPDQKAVGYFAGLL